MMTECLSLGHDLALLALGSAGVLTRRRLKRQA